MGRLILQFGQSKMILSLIVIIGGAIGYMNYGELDEALIPERSFSGRDSIASFADFELDFSILDDERYKALEIFGEKPVYPGVVGDKRSPFAPIGE